MPLVYQQDINDYAKLGVWHLLESESFFEEVSSISVQISHPERRLQHMAGRYLLTVLDAEFPVHQISIAPSKKPFLKEGSYHFSISHAGDYVAAIISKSSSMGIDIEMPRSSIEPLANKFLSKKDCIALAPISLDLMHQYTIAWCVKESVFKWYGQGSVDFKNNIQIVRIAKKDGFFFVDCLFDKEGPLPLVVQVFCFHGYYLSWVCEKK